MDGQTDRGCYCVGRKRRFLEGGEVNQPDTVPELADCLLGDCERYPCLPYAAGADNRNKPSPPELLLDKTDALSASDDSGRRCWKIVPRGPRLDRLAFRFPTPRFCVFGFPAADRSLSHW
jgi:hypothetical protein